MNRGKQKAEVSVGTKFSVEEISQILELMRDNEVNEFRLELGDGKLFLKRGSETQIAPQQLPPTNHYANYYPPAQQNSAPIPAQQASLPLAASPLAPAAPVVSEKKYHELKSPMVGTFYKRASPDAPPYAQVGDTVRKGQTLCIVEAMKLMNEIQCDVPGKIVEALLEDGQMAEYGEVLFRIDTGA